MKTLVDKVRKRDGTIATFEPDRITQAIHKAMQAVGEGDYEEAEQITQEIIVELNPIRRRHKTFIPTVEFELMILFRITLSLECLK